MSHAGRRVVLYSAAPMPTPRKTQLRKPFQKARRVDPRPITGRESARDLLEHAFGAYVGRQERTAYELMRRSIAEDCSIFLTLSGAMTPAGLHQSCLIPLIERGIVSALTTTGANLYHDAHRIIGHAIREVNPNAGDLQLRLARVIRIYDLGFWEEALLDTDKLFSALMQGPDYQRKMTTPEFHGLLGRDIAKMEKALGVEQPSLLSQCWKHGVPIFVGAVQDGSIFLEAVEAGSVYVHTDVTAVFPWLTHALMSDAKMRRKPKRLLDRLAEARAFLDRDVEKNRRELLKTVVYPGTPTRHEPESTVR